MQKNIFHKIGLLYYDDQYLLENEEDYSDILMHCIFKTFLIIYFVRIILQIFI
jgi:hypothetical protein